MRRPLIVPVAEVGAIVLIQDGDDRNAPKERKIR